MLEPLRQRMAAMSWPVRAMGPNPHNLRLGRKVPHGETNPRTEREALDRVLAQPPEQRFNADAPDRGVALSGPTEQLPVRPTLHCRRAEHHLRSMVLDQVSHRTRALPLVTGGCPRSPTASHQRPGLRLAPAPARRANRSLRDRWSGRHADCRQGRSEKGYPRVRAGVIARSRRERQRRELPVEGAGRDCATRPPISAIR
jgi:hypothetical protein